MSATTLYIFTLRLSQFDLCLYPILLIRIILINVVGTVLYAFVYHDFLYLLHCTLSSLLTHSLFLEVHRVSVHTRESHDMLGAHP